MKFKLSKREIIIILILLLAVGTFLLYSYVYTPLQENIEKIKQEIKTEEALNKSYLAKVARLSSLEKEVASNKELITKSVTGLYGKTYQEEYIIKLRDIISESKVLFNELSYTGESEIGSGKSSDYTLKYECNYSQFQTILDFFISHEKVIVCNSLKASLKSGIHDTGLTGNSDETAEQNITVEMQFSFYYIEGYDEGTADPNKYFK